MSTARDALCEAKYAVLTIQSMRKRTHLGSDVGAVALEPEHIIRAHEDAHVGRHGLLLTRKPRNVRVAEDGRREQGCGFLTPGGPI